jgi:hypothetical protein
MCQQRSALLTSTDRTPSPLWNRVPVRPARHDRPIFVANFRQLLRFAAALATSKVNFLTFQLARVRPLVAKHPTKRLTGRITTRAVAKTNRSLSWSS